MAVMDWLLLVVHLVCLYYICTTAYNIRLHAINEYGRIIHEFDPWFNFRATQYLADNGWTAFFHWYDYKSWYPLGRPVGTTIYPGMQITAVALWKILNFVGVNMSLNDVCVFMPAWFGVVASLFLGLLAREVSGSSSAGVAAAAVMAIIPAHIMRSVGGGFDNESVAVTAMCSTFFFWCRSLRNDDSWPIGIIAGLAYINMVASWGGYVFVINMIGVHAAGLVLIGRYSTKLHRAYTLFYVIGTAGATRVPVVGWTPLKSLEQLGPFGVLVWLQLIEFCEIQRRRRKLTGAQYFTLLFQVLACAGAVVAIIAGTLYPTGYFGPLSARVRGLLVKHTRTGNPLVDSVAEHQPASAQAYWQYLHYACYAAPVGLLRCVLWRRTDADVFLALYAVIAYFFSSKMVRLIIIMGPMTSALAGIAIGLVLEWALRQGGNVLPLPEDPIDAAATTADGEPADGAAGAAGAAGPGKAASRYAGPGYLPRGLRLLLGKLESAREAVGRVLGKVYRHVLVRVLVRMPLAAGAMYLAHMYGTEFSGYCHSMAQGMSNPSIVFKANLRDGRTIVVNDYIEAYHWLRDNTPEDSRVMAWWDYGYQIAGIGNRTTIADGNTWNHEHIATLGKCLSSEETAAHKIVRHLADYVLVWAGGGGDDLAKSPHMARIGNSVYRDICPGDPTCRQFGFTRDGHPTPMMAVSLLYKAISHNQRPGVQLNGTLFREVYLSKYGKVRIYKVLKVSKKSKKWIANPANRVCDAPGSWYCTGQYPPALDPLIARRRSFKQLEDFNVKRDKSDEDYYKAYMRNMDGGGGGGGEEDGEMPYELQFAPRSKAKAAWEDTPLTTKLWEVINGNKARDLRALVGMEPNIVHARSSDGRGPLWWAYEYGRAEIIKILLSAGADPAAKDAKGVKPRDLQKSGNFRSKK